MEKEKHLFEENKIDWEKLKKLINTGKLIVYPTDTVYGVGGIMEEKVLEKIYKSKNRPKTSPIIALISDKKYIDKIAKINEKNRDKIEKLINNFWPGGLTIILEKKDIVPNIMVNNTNTIGIRIPNLSLAREIIELAGGILPTTSANISTHVTPKKYEDLEDIYLDKVDVIVKGNTKIGIESTIIDMSKDKPILLRKGAVSIDDIEKVIGKILMGGIN